MNQCQFKGSSTPYGCFAVNASVRENGEVWCHQHYPPNVANRKRNPQRLALYPKLVEVLQFALEPSGAYSRDRVEYLNNVILAIQAQAKDAIAQAREIEA